MGGFTTPTLPYYLRADDDDEDENGFASGLTSSFRSDTPTSNDSAAPLPQQQVAASAPGGGVPGGSSAPPLAAPSLPNVDRSQLNAWENRRALDSEISTGKAVTPRWWERGLGGLAAGAMAFGHVPGAVEGGRDITDRRFNQAENERGGRLAQDNAGIQAEQGKVNAANQNYEQGLQQFNANYRATAANQLARDRAAQEQQRLQGIAPGTARPADPKNPLGTWTAKTVGGQTIETQPPKEFLTSREGIAAQREADIQGFRDRGSPLTADEEKFYRTNGKLHEPVPSTNIHIPSAESQEYTDWKRSLGHNPTPEEISGFKRGGTAGKPRMGTPGQFSGLTKDTAAAYAKAEADFRVISSDPSASPEEKAAARAQLESEKARIGQVNSDRTRDLGGTPQEDVQQGRQPAAVPAAAQSTTPSTQVKGKTLKVGDPVNLPGGGQGIVTGINPKTGKPIVKRQGK